MFYSKANGSFYSTEVNGENIPADAVAISREQHAALLQGQSEGLQIAGDDTGKPILVTPPPPTLEQLAGTARAQRDQLIAASDWTQVGDSPLSDQVKKAYQVYRAELRDLTKQKDFPTSIKWPEAPK